MTRSFSFTTLHSFSCVKLLKRVCIKVEEEKKKSNPCFYGNLVSLENVIARILLVIPSYFKATSSSGRGEVGLGPRAHGREVGTRGKNGAPQSCNSVCCERARKYTRHVCFGYTSEYECIQI